MGAYSWPRRSRGAGVVLLAILSGGCVGSAPPKPVVQAAAPAPDASLQPIEFAVNKINIRHGDSVGRSVCGRIFRKEAPIAWETGAINERSREFNDIFLDAARAAGVPVAKSSDTLFTPQSSAVRATYAVGSVISRIAYEGCRGYYEGNPNRYDDGKTTVSVTWEVYSRLEDKIALRIETVGTHVAKDEVKFGFVTFIALAYRDAADQLMRSSTFREAIAGKPDAPAIQAAAPVAAEKMTLPAIGNLSGPLSGNIDSVRRAAVTIDLGRGHGSGFFITSDGWVLTNAHVARGSQTVKVILADGRPMFGQVMRVHDARDVALVKVDGAGFSALPLRGAPVTLTEEVYAIGTPIDKKLSGTVTRGIVSQVRTNRRNMTDIQADVAILPGSSGGPLVDGSGNVVGVSYAGVGELNAGVNFFIPIQDALAKLNVSLGGA